MKKKLALFMAVVILVSLAPVFAAAAEEEDVLNGRITLTLTHTVEASVLDAAQFYGSGIVVRSDDGTYQILDHLGVNALGESYDYVRGCGRDAWCVYRSEKGVNSCGLVKADGTVLIPVSAAIIDAVQTFGDDVRFLEVVYATEEVSSANDAFLYTTEDLVSLNAGENDRLYAGYARYYDLEQGRFVGDLERTDNTELSYSVYAVGDKLYFSDRNTIYAADGSVFAAFSGSVVDGFFVSEEDGICTVFDADLNRVAAFDRWPSCIYRNGQLFGFDDYDAERAYVLDVHGEQVGELPFRYAPEGHGALLYGYDKNDRYLVMDVTGKTLIDAKAKVSYVSEAPMGFLTLSFTDDREGLLYPDGTVVKADEQSGLLLSVDRGDGIAMLVLKDRDFTLKLPEETGFKTLLEEYEAMPVLFAAVKDGQATLFSAIDGQALLVSEETDSYDVFFYALGYVYALRGDVFDVYQVDIRY